MNTFLFILLGITCGIIGSSIGIVFGESIGDQLNNARETNKLIDEKQAQAGLNSRSTFMN